MQVIIYSCVKSVEVEWVTYKTHLKLPCFLEDMRVEQDLGN